MKNIYSKAIFMLLLLLPLSTFAANVSGVLNAYSFKDQQITVNNKKYSVDIENLPIIYGNGEVGTDVLRRGLKVKLIFSEDTINHGDKKIIHLVIMSQIAGLES